jgi:hypothetical protein
VLDFGGIAHLDADQPRVAVGVVVDQLRRRDKVVVGLGDLAGYGRIDVGRRFDGLDDAERLAFVTESPTFGSSTNTTAELVLRVVGDSDLPACLR